MADFEIIDGVCVIPDGTTEIRNGAFEDCKELISVVIPNSVTRIGESTWFRPRFEFWARWGGAFSGCTSLQSIKIPHCVNKIGDNAFIGCTSLSSIEIPDSVTEIGNQAFKGCRNLSSIEIPDSVTEIGICAFEGCLGVESIKVSSNNPNFCSESNCLLSKDRTRLIFGCKHSIIPDSVTEIGYYTFAGCTSMASIVIPDSVTVIRDSAFAGCTNLASIVIPDSVTEIGNWAFYGCTSLVSIEIPDSVTKIGNDAFDGCTSLVSIEIPDSVTEIGNGAFYGCTSLVSIVIPRRVSKIAENAFCHCPGVESIKVSSNNPNFCSESNCLLSKDRTRLILGCKHSIIPDSVTVIRDSAFAGCTNLASIVIPDSVTEIGNWAFGDCSSLSSIEIPDSVTEIGNWAFGDCSSLSSIEIPDSVTEIGNGAFEGCASLTLIVIPRRISKIADNTFKGCTSLVSIVIPRRVSKIGNSAFEGCASLTSIVIPRRVSKIADNTFKGCASLSSIEIPRRVTEVGNRAFEGCTRLATIEIPRRVSKIADNTFKGCTSLVSIVIPDSVTEIGNDAFMGCTSLSSIEIPSRVSKIGSVAFWGCLGVESIKVSSDNPYFCSESNCLLSKDRTRLILGCKHSIIPDSVTVIGNGAFRNCASLSSIEIPDSVTEIGYCAFQGCSSLASIEIPRCVSKLADNAFCDCPEIESIKVSSNNPDFCSESNCLLSKDGTRLIRGCKHSIIPSSVTEIGNDAFMGCTSLSSIEISDSVTKIGNDAFWGCSGLNIMVIGEQDPENCSLRKNCLYGDAPSRITLYVPIGTGSSYRQHPFFGQFKEIKENRHKVNSAVHNFDSEFDDAEEKIESFNKQDLLIIPENTQELLVDYDYKSSSEVDDYPFYYSPLLGTPIFPYRRRKILREGVSEQSFYLKLKKYIDCEELSVYNDVSLQVSNQYHYEPDIAVISTAGRNLRIDIEIDEPYSGYDRTPIHCIGYDDIRDQTLINLGWLVIRLSEEQIVTSPLNCIKYIGEIISDILPSFEIPESLLHDINDSEESFYFISRWTKEEALVMAGDKYRELYLNRSGFGYVENLSDATETSKQTITEFIMSTDASIETNIISSEKAQICTSSCEQTLAVFQTEDEVSITEYVKTHPQTIITLPKQRENRIEVVSPYDSTIEEMMRPYFPSMSQDAYKKYDKAQHRLEQEILLYYGYNKRRFTESTAFRLIKEYIKSNNIVPSHAGMQIGHPSYHITGRIGFIFGDTLYDAKILRLGTRGEDVGISVAASLGDVPRSRYEIEETIKAEIVEQILNTSIKNMVILEVNLRTNRVSEVKLRRNKVARFILNDGKYDMSIRKI